ncbi:MAG: lipid-A-disaccharide synthase, partial [Elusimicrobiaceae bacterium]|nr:lipid-A-disaccharide synthase [Elusimicrobiaceae bacterium]
ITGFVEPIKKVPQLAQLLKKIRARFETDRPAAVIAVDYYGFNYRVLLLAKRYNIPCFYYVTPQVWASRQYRAKRLAALTQKMYVIYPFEPNFHKQFGGNAVFLGNPLLDKIPAPLEKNYPTQDDKNYPWKLGLLPGSRPSEISRLLPVFYQTFKQVVAHYPQTHAYLFALPQADEKQLFSLLGETPHPQFHLIKETDYKQRARMDYLLACSGTATLENALLGVPMLVAYKMFYPTYLVARCVVKVKDISLVNILAGKRLVPELIQQEATAQKCAQETLAMFSHPQNLIALRNELLQLRASLGEPGVADRAALDILKELSK